MRLLAWSVFVSLLAPAVTWGQAAEASSPADKFVGTWRLVLFEDVKDGRKVYPFGEKPLGIFIYTSGGHVAIQIASPANPACVSPRSKAESKLPVCTPEQMQALLDGYVAYWGTYTVDAPAGVVIHHVQSALGNGYAGTDQQRPFRLEGDRLIIGDGKTWTRVLERVR